MNFQNTPWDMISVCKQIVRESKMGSKIFDETDRKVAKLLMRAIKFVNTFDESAFRIFTKGYGVVCQMYLKLISSLKSQGGWNSS